MVYTQLTETERYQISSLKKRVFHSVSLLGHLSEVRLPSAEN